MLSKKSVYHLPLLIPPSTAKTTPVVKSALVR
jgi:hypothetical protein